MSPELAECSFQPKINELPRGMDAALLYVAQDPFQRLASTPPPPALRVKNEEVAEWGGDVSVVQCEV